MGPCVDIKLRAPRWRCAPQGCGAALLQAMACFGAATRFTCSKSKEGVARFGSFGATPRSHDCFVLCSVALRRFERWPELRNAVCFLLDWVLSAPRRGPMVLPKAHFLL